MKKLVKEVGELLRNLETLNLLQTKDIKLCLNPKTAKYELTIRVGVSNADVLYFCLDRFQEVVTDEGVQMTVAKNDLRSILVIKYYEMDE